MPKVLLGVPNNEESKSTTEKVTTQVQLSSITGKEQYVLRTSCRRTKPVAGTTTNIETKNTSLNIKSRRIKTIKPRNKRDNGTMLEPKIYTRTNKTNQN